MVVEAGGKVSSGEARQLIPGICPSLMDRLRGPGCRVRSNQEAHFKSRWRPTSSMKSHGFHEEQPRLGGDSLHTPEGGAVSKATLTVTSIRPK